jgi:hypothetical protein
LRIPKNLEAQENPCTMKATTLEIMPSLNTNRRDWKNHVRWLRDFLLILLLNACFALLPQMQAVVPPPDGCYPNYTTADGCDALNFLTTGAGNTGVGWRSLFVDSTGSFNTGVGGGALALNNGDSNTAVGAAALLLNTTGVENTAVGTDALVYNDTGDHNTATGAFALFSNTSGGGNTAIGHNALPNNTTGTDNTAIGRDALSNNTTGSHNLALGFLSGASITTGDFNIDIGNGGVPGDTFTIRIGGAHTKTFIAGIRGAATVNNDALPVLVDSAGQLGTISSSARFKKDIKRMDKTSEAILAFQPVTFHYKSDDTNRPEFGLVAEEVAKVNPDLVVRDENGEIYTVRYEAVNAMLLNEFLKEHKAFVEEERKVEKLETTVAGLVATVKEQTTQIQKVSAQLALSKSAPQTVLNDQ